jgi:uncharacterized membrane protein YphA (DoxX/SURF4 family)
MHALNLVTWAVQIFLGLFFVAAGFPKLLNRGLEQWTGFSDLPRALSTLIGIAEVLGGLALVLPMALGIAPWLTPLAAVGLAVIVAMATGFHLRANEHLPALETTLWAAIAAVIAISRWHLLASRATATPGVLIALLAVLVPAVIINLVVLLRAHGQRPAVATARSGGV